MLQLFYFIANLLFFINNADNDNNDDEEAKWLHYKTNQRIKKSIKQEI